MMMLGTEPVPFNKPIFARPMKVRRSRPEKSPTKASKLPKIKMHVRGGKNLNFFGSNADGSQSTDSGVDVHVSDYKSKNNVDENENPKTKDGENNSDNRISESQKILIDDEAEKMSLNSSHTLNSENYSRKKVRRKKLFFH